MTKTFPSNPSTVTITFKDDRPPLSMIFREVTMSTEEQPDPPVALVMVDGDYDRLLPLLTLDEVTRTLWEGEGTTCSVVVRPSVESDGVIASVAPGAPSIPMPVPVMRYYAALSEGFTVPKLYALSEDDGFVATMMLDSEPGIYIRYSGAWHQITDEDAVDGLSVHEVDAGGLDLFDQYDRQGLLVGVTAMPTKDPIFGGTSDSEDDEPLVAAATRPVPRLNTLEDLPSAIAAAVENPDLQWWVERRAKALGASDVQFPW